MLEFRHRTLKVILAASLAVVALPDVQAADPAAPATIAPSAKAIAGLLAVDTTPGRARLETIKPLYQQAHSLAPNDARVEYAYSLVLLRLFLPAEAQDHLQRALELDPFYVPANQAVIRGLLKARQFVEAAERLSAFASKLDPGRPESIEAAEWLGRIVNSVIAATGTPDAQSHFAYHDRLLRTSLPPVLLSSYEKGFASVEFDLEQLTESIDAARSSAESKREVTKARVDADLVKDQQEIKLKQQDSQKTRQKWDEWVVDQTAKADDLLREQERRFQELDNAATTQLSAVTALRLAIDRIDRGLVPQQRVTGLTPPNRLAIELQLSLEEQRLAAIYDQQSTVARAGSETLAARRNAVASYQRATGVALKEAATLDRWEKRNKSVADNLKKAAEKKPALVATLEARIKSFNTWDPVDFESEKRRLLADLGVTQSK